MTNGLIVFYLDAIMAKKSKVSIDKNNRIVTKTVLKWPEHTFDREVRWLTKFCGANSFPSLLGFDSHMYTITMSYCGEPISKSNCPIDWQDQVRVILGDLAHFKCRHNDIKPKEILVDAGSIRLVDFGWATEWYERVPEDWPVNLGIYYRVGPHRFDDGFALVQSILDILK